MAKIVKWTRHERIFLCNQAANINQKVIHNFQSNTAGTTVLRNCLPKRRCKDITTTSTEE